jgi:hypothetical protein
MYVCALIESNGMTTAVDDDHISSGQVPSGRQRGLKVCSEQLRLDKDL